jgi:hypothetical protein
LFFVWFLINEAKIKAEKERQDAIAKAELEEKKRVNRIEQMSESEFISFVKSNRNELSQHFKNGGVTKLGHGEETMRWQTTKYVIESTIETNGFNEFIKIYRRSDNAEIFSGSWGYGF